MHHVYDIRINEQRQFQVVQFAHWAAHGDAWLCAHDLFHHHPDDDGSMQCEAMSFGAELWIGFPGAGLEAISPVSFGGAVSAAYEHQPDVERLMLRCDPPAIEALEAGLADRLREVVDEGLAVVVRNIVRYRDEAGLEPMSGAALRALCGEPNRERYVRWMAYGYRRAERRFPAARKAQRLIESFQRFLEAAGHHPRLELTVDVDEAALSFSECVRTAPACEPVTGN